MTGDYGHDGGLGDDFRPCALVTPKPVELYDEIVPSSLRQRMGHRGRLSEVSGVWIYFCQTSCFYYRNRGFHRQAAMAFSAWFAASVIVCHARSKRSDRAPKVRTF